jgi:hypothetical protein
MKLKLFSKEKELILKITNAILIIWLLASLCFVISNLATLIIKDIPITYSEYQNNYCTTEKEVSKNCSSDYNNYIINNTNNYAYEKRSLVISIGITIITIGFIYGLNYKKDKK